MKKNIYEYTYEEFEALDVLDADGDCIAMRDIVFEVEMHTENDGIGNYEFHGSRGYDAGTDSWIVDEIKWDKSIYNDQENTDIAKWLDENFFELVDVIVKTREGEQSW
jgi:hypothetical protein